MSRRNGIGCKGGTSATAGKRATTYTVALPDGSTVQKRSFYVDSDSAIATGFMHQGKPVVAVWPGQPTWEGDFGRLTATRVQK